MHPALVGFGLGFLVALQLGPMSLFLIRSTLRAGWAVGLAIGAGIAVVDGTYAACGAAGAAPLLDIEPVRMLLGLAGGALLIVIGLRTLHQAFRVRVGLETRRRDGGPPAGVPCLRGRDGLQPGHDRVLGGDLRRREHRGRRTHDRGQPCCWSWACRSGASPGSAPWPAVSLLARRGLGPRAMRLADAVAGLGMLGFGGALVYSATRER